MRGVQASALFALAALLLAGCSLPDAPAPAAQEPVAALATRDVAPIELFTPAGLQRVALAASVEPRWMTPEEVVHVDASTSAQVVDWFARSRNPIRHDAPAAMAERIAAGGSATLAPRVAGRHVFDVGGAPLFVSIVPDAPSASALVVLQRGAAGWIVTPEGVRGGPGTRVLVENRGEAEALVDRRDVETYLASGKNASFLMTSVPELGDYDIVASAIDAERVGENATRVVYDDRKPEPAWGFGPFTGQIVNAQREPDRYEVRLARPAIGGRVEVVATSALPVPFAIEVRIRDALGENVAAGPAPGFDLPPLARGATILAIQATEGALVDYEVRISGLYAMDPPETFFST